MQQKIRRDPMAHLKSLEMDPDRKMLIVEGKEDRFLIEYLSDNQLDSNLIILEIDSIDIAVNVEGGNRGRLLYFANLTSEEADRLKFFIDKDYSQYIGEYLPNQITETDFKDIESYLIDEECLTKFLKIGIKTEKVNSADFISEIKKAQFFGFVRIASLKNGYNLSVNKTNERISKYLSLEANGKVEIKNKEYLTSLIQNSTIKVPIQDLESAVEKVKDELKDEDCRYIIHGKDLLSLVTEICYKMGYKKDNIDNVFWMSMDKSQIGKYENLKYIVDFCKKNLP